jgi:hypothetical protein
MPTVELVHLISPRRVAARVLPTVIADIRNHQRLAAGYGHHGYGVYAWFADQVPADRQHLPGVVFELEAARVETIRQSGVTFAFVRVPFRDDYLPITLKGWRNLP